MGIVGAASHPQFSDQEGPLVAVPPRLRRSGFLSASRTTTRSALRDTPAGLMPLPTQVRRTSAAHSRWSFKPSPLPRRSVWNSLVVRRHGLSAVGSEQRRVVLTRRRVEGVLRSMAILCIVLSCTPPATDSSQAVRWSLIPEVSIGSLSGDDGEPTFGAVSELAALPVGVAVVDPSVPQVYVFDDLGTLVHELGQQGSGPGEYEQVSGIALTEDGTVLVRDSRRALIFYSATTGELITEWPVRADYVGADPLSIVGPNVLLRVPRRRSALESFWRSREFEFVRIREPGVVVDTLRPSRIRHNEGGLYWSPHQPSYHVALFGDGGSIEGAGNAYQLSIRDSNGLETAEITRPFTPAPLPSSARIEIEDHRAWLVQRGNRSAPFYPDPPEHLPIFDRILITEEDQAWIRRPVIGEDGGVRYIVDIFDRAGAFLASLDIPPRVRVGSVRGDHVWAIRRGDFDEPYVVRYNIERHAVIEAS